MHIVSAGGRPTDRSKDWMAQAEHLFAQAKWLREGGFFDGVCFYSQQAAEMAVKAIFQSHRIEAWGHMITKLLNDLPDDLEAPNDVRLAAARLDRFYIQTRYPNGFASGSPKDYFKAEDAEEALVYCEQLIEFVRGFLDG